MILPTTIKFLPLLHIIPGKDASWFIPQQRYRAGLLLLSLNI